MHPGYRTAVARQVPYKRYTLRPTAPEPPMSHPFAALTPDLVLDAVESLGYLSDARVLALNS